jgi:predicted dehydrogenase
MDWEGGEGRPALRVGLAGAGAWARRAYLPALRADPRTTLVAVADAVRSRAEGIAAEGAGIAIFDSAAEMVAAAALDLVCVVTPDDCHPADAGAALAAGVPVLCEKPLAVTVADARLLVGQAGTLPTRIGFTTRYAPAVRRLRELVASGEIGEPRLLQAFQQNGQYLDPAKPVHWKMDVARTGGGAIVEYGVHTIDLARWIMGEADRVASTSRTWTNERPSEDGERTIPVTADDSTAWLMSFASGALGLCHAGWTTPGRPPGFEVRVFGATGAVSCRLSDDLPGDQGLWLARADGRFEPIEIPHLASPGIGLDRPWFERWQGNLIGEFVDQIVGSCQAGPDAPTFVDGLKAQEILAAVTAAAGQDRWVAVERA